MHWFNKNCKLESFRPCVVWAHFKLRGCLDWPAVMPTSGECTSVPEDEGDMLLTV